MRRKVVIIGSSRKQGQTRAVVDTLQSLTSVDIIDLNDYNIGYYDYQHRSKDDFLSLAKRIISDYDVYIFATPVYWYTMSGIMKVFFDRITDLLDNQKEWGRKLRTKNMAVLSSSVGDNLGDKFWLPFTATARYLGMHYLGDIHTIESEDYLEDLERFVRRIE